MTAVDPITAASFRRAAPLCIRYRLTLERAEYLGHRVLELRERNLSYPAITAVLDLYEGVTVTDEGVRCWLGRLGAEKNPNKARPRNA